MNRYTLKQAEKVAETFLVGYNRVERGENNWVFERGDTILTVPKHERVKDYAVRVAATRLLDSFGIPVPEILDYSPSSEERPEYLLVRKVIGDHPKLEKCNKLERERIHFSAGEILREIHKIKTEGFGRLEKNMTGTMNSWVEFCDRFFYDSLGRLIRSKEHYDRFGHILESEYLKNRTFLGEFKDSRFLHADFHMGNLLFKGGKVTAVLDLDIVTSGDGNWDLGHYCHTFNVCRDAGVKSFKNGYGNSYNPDLERLYCLMIWTRKVGSQSIQRPEALKETVPELEKILAGKT